MFFFCLSITIGLAPIARAVMKEIRCLVCQNQSIEDSNAELALDLRSLIREQVIEGKTPDQIKAFLVERYGDWVLLAPPVKPSTYFLWASPFLVLLLAVFMVFMRRQTPATPTPLSKTEQEKLQSLLQEKGGKE